MSYDEKTVKYPKINKTQILNANAQQDEIHRRRTRLK